MTVPRRLPIIALLGFGAACASPTEVAQPAGPPMALQSVPQSALTFLHHAPGAPGLATLQASFYAVSGDTREIELYYHLAPGAVDSSRLMRFRVEKRALLAWPDGTPFLTGDSVLITVTVVDSTNLVVDLQPSGLTFNPKYPARLWLWWVETDPDLNGDGLVTAADTTGLTSLAIWAQESPGLPWDQLATTLGLAESEAQTKVYGFTRYALAY